MRDLRNALHSTYGIVGFTALAGLVLSLSAGCPGTIFPPGGCNSDADCNDDDPCTSDVCDASGTCVNDAVLCPGGQPIDLTNTPDEVIAALNVESEITGVTIDSPPVVTFQVTTANGAPITGIGALWEDDDRFVRFTIAKLEPGTNGDPSEWVPYTRDTTNNGSTPPDYDTGSSLVDHGNGTYTFTFNTNVTTVSGVTYDASLTHRVAGQIGSGDVPLQAQNLVLDFVPAGGAVTETRAIAVMDSCNECHDGLVFHGRRFKVEYCVNCHTPDLAEGEGDFKYMIHKIHSAQKFDVLDDGVDYSEVTYPQALNNCRKCHNGDDAATPDGDNWKTVPNMVACGSCHQISFTSPPPAGLTLHSGGAQANNSGCTACHPATGGLAGIEDKHASEIASGNNPNVPAGAVNFAYEIAEATASGATNVAIRFRILADGTPVMFGAPGTTLLTGFTGDPDFLFAYALPQPGFAAPADWNNLGRRAAQPRTVPITDVWNGTAGTLSGPDVEGYYTATVSDAFPAGATMRAVGLQAYFTQVEPAVARHTPSVIVTVTGDQARRAVVDGSKCSACHEWFEAHGGNRVIAENNGAPICTACHVPNLSSSGRSIDPAKAADRDGDPLTNDPSAATVDLGTSDTWTWPEDSNNFKDMIHGIHAAGVRTFDYEFVRGRNDGIYYNWSEVTFPAQNDVRNCLLCHMDGTYELPLNENALETTVRTTGTDDGLDGDDFVAVGDARGNVPNDTDWVSSPTASTCYMCHHNSEVAVAHMRQNGGILSVANPDLADFTQRQNLDTVESCVVCHGPGKIADISVVHELE